MRNRWLIACTAVGILSGCDAASVPITTPASRAAAPALRFQTQHSWMAKGASKIDLMYVSDFEKNDVSAYSYPDGRLVGVLAGILKNFVYPTGLCADKAGNVYIPDSANSSVLEYGHGSIKRLRSLRDRGEYPYSCAVDPLSGDLAVVNLESVRGPGGVSVYARALGRPKKYNFGFVYKFFFDGYDDKGNLFVDGSDDVPSEPFAFLELAHGAKSLRAITLDYDFDTGGGVAWDGRHLAVAESSTSSVQRFAVQRKIGRHAGSTPLRTCRFVTQFFVDGDTIVATSFHGKSVAFWKYPAGGPPIKRIGGFGEPFGVTLSKASSHT
ncbi:MAG TPA: hypothetical protein VFE16_12730 [Candidatus Cybelea sp.]|nr:hypothetical protein [Candidatus Cybelea sp.]